MKHGIIFTEHYALIVSNSGPINMGDSIYDLVCEEIHTANDEWDNNTHPEWAKVIAHRSLKDAPILEGIPLLPEFSQEDDVYRIAEEMLTSHPDFKAEGFSDYQNGRHNGIIDGYNKAKETYKYTEDDLINAMYKGSQLSKKFGSRYMIDLKDISDYTQSLQRPKYFECKVEINCTGNNDNGCFLDSNGHDCGCVCIKTIINPQGLTELVGSYIL
jgi:hypothetical protein